MTPEGRNMTLKGNTLTRAGPLLGAERAGPRGV